MALGVMGFMNAALGFLFLAIVYLSSSIRAVWVTPHGGYGQRESASIRGKCQPPGETPARPGDRFAIIRDPFSLTIPCHPASAVEPAKKNVAVLAACQALLFT